MENAREYNSQCYHEGILQVELYNIAITNILSSFVRVGAEVLLLGLPTLTIICAGISDADYTPGSSHIRSYHTGTSA